MNANYDLAFSMSVQILQDYSTNEVPVNLKEIIHNLKRTIRTCSYTKYSQKSGLSIQEICDFFESNLGACAYNPGNERYIIYYNDTKMNIGLNRFTIAHELGHIFLEHHKKADTDIMLRKGISGAVYKTFENEANCFARNLLAPHPLVTLVTDVSKDYSISDIMVAFNISYEAAKTRRKLLANDGYRIKKNHKEYFYQYKINYGYYCHTCMNAEAGNSRYCKICGEENSVFLKGVDRLHYEDGVKLDENMRVMKCPRCDNEGFTDNANFCKICGTKLYNHCLGEEIRDYNGNYEETIYHANPSNARFCETCGNITEFFKEKFLNSWEEYQKELNDMLGIPNDDDIPF